MVEHSAFNRRVDGSNPSCRTNFNYMKIRPNTFQKAGESIASHNNSFCCTALTDVKANHAEKTFFKSLFGERKEYIWWQSSECARVGCTPREARLIALCLAAEIAKDDEEVKKILA